MKGKKSLSDVRIDIHEQMEYAEIFAFFAFPWQMMKRNTSFFQPLELRGFQHEKCFGASSIHRRRAFMCKKNLIRIELGKVKPSIWKEMCVCEIVWKSTRSKVEFVKFTAFVKRYFQTNYIHFAKFQQSILKFSI